MTFADHVNPVLLKELRQTVRSRAILASIGTYLTLLFIICLFTVSVAAKDNPPSTYGDVLFAWLRGVCSVVVTGIIPFMVMNRTTNERQGDASGVLGLTLLTPSQWADGKAVGASLFSALFVAATLPFTALAYLLRGLDLSKVLLFPPLFLAMAVFFSYLAVMFGSLRINAICKRVLFCGILFLGYFSQFRGMGLNVGMRWLLSDILSVFHRQAAPLAVFIIVCGCALAALLLRSAAVARLTPPNFNFRGGMRRIILFVGFAFVAFLGFSAWRSGQLDLMVYITTFGLPIIFAQAFSEAALPAGYSRRVRSEIAPGRLRRVAQYLFFTGAENGLALAILLQLVVLTVAFFACCVPAKNASDIQEVRDATLMMFCIACYANAALLLARTLWHVAFRHQVRPFWIPIAAFAVLALNSLMHLLFLAASDSQIETDFWFGSLFSVIGAFSRRGHIPLQLHHAVFAPIAFIVAFLLFLPLLIRSFRDFRPPDP